MGLLEDALRAYAKYEDRTTNPATPTSGSALVFVKDGKLHTVDDAGTVVEYGTGGGGGGDGADGELGYNEITANSDNSTGAAVTVVSVAVTLPASRRIRVTGHGRINISSDSTRGLVRIADTGGSLRIIGDTTRSTGGGGDSSFYGSYHFDSGAGGAETFSLTVERLSGTGNVRASTGTSIHVDDLGPA